MKPTILFLSALLFFACKVFSQSDPSVISAGGGTNNTNGISLEWTMGEPLVTSASTSSKLITQGFHQPLIVVSKPVMNNNIATLFVSSVFPNPVQSILNVKLTAGLKGLISLVDLQGNVMFSEQVSTKSNTVRINMERFLPSVYVLNVRDATGRVIESHKVIKVN
jgi:hypothetical protein